jgi:hypothetical protein
MGYSISWIAFRHKTKDQVLEAARLVDTGESDEDNEAPMAGATLPGDWYLVRLDDCFHPFVTPSALAKFSDGCQVLGCQIEEGTMASDAFFYDHGHRVWNVTHQSERGIYDLAIEGAPPEFFGALRERLIEQQDKEGGEAADVDFIFDIPIQLAAEICLYRHDNAYFDWGEPNFTRLRAVGEQ